MEGGIREPTASAALDPLFAAQLDRLESLSEDELLTVVGSESLTLPEYMSAAVHTYSSEEVAEALKREQLVAQGPVDLVSRGRHTVERVLADCGDLLRDSVCPLWNGNAKRRDLALAIAGVLTNLLPLIGTIVAGIALLIARDRLEELCKNWIPAPREIPASA